MTRVIAVANQKGGVGKTTTTINICGAMSKEGKTLVIDFDPQGTCTEGLKIQPLPQGMDLSAALVSKWADDPEGVWRGDLSQLIRKKTDTLDVLPTSLDMETLPVDLVAYEMGEIRLSRIVNHIVAQGIYDYIIIDGVPSLGLMMNNQIIASNEVIIPTLVKQQSMVGLKRLEKLVHHWERELSRPIKIRGLVLNQVNKNSGALGKALYEKFHDLSIPVLFEIPYRAAAVDEAFHAGQTVEDHNPQSEAAEMFRTLAKLVIG